MMTLGGVDSSAMVGNFTTSHTVVSTMSSWWTLNYGGTKFNGKQLSSPVKLKYAIVDTGTTFMYLPASEY